MRKSSRSGMAVFIVVMVCAVVGVFVAIVMFHGRDLRRKDVEKRDRTQAAFLAKGAQSHFLLKLRLLPTELYDAVSYAVGKNPWFDFSIEVASVSGDTFTAGSGIQALFGPMFFTGSSSSVSMADSHIDVDRAKEGDGIYQNGSAGFSGSVAENRPKMEYLLNHFTLDIASDYPDEEPDKAIVTFASAPHQDVAQMGISGAVSDNGRISNWSDPFNGRYFVREIRILGTGGMAKEKRGKKYNTDSVMVITEATVRKDDQVSLVTRVGGKLKPLLIQRDTKTSLKQEQGWLEVKEERETDEEFRKRAISSRDKKDESGRRTETCTEVYFVTRESTAK